MTLEEKAIEFIRETKCKPKDRPDKQIKLFYEEELKLLIGFATEVAKELEQENNKLLDVINNQDVKIADLEKQIESNQKYIADLEESNNAGSVYISNLENQIEKLLDFVVERTVCCDVCPNSDTCRNDEGTCPHAVLLKENEDKVTREWILKSITKE